MRPWLVVPLPPAGAPWLLGVAAAGERRFHWRSRDGRTLFSGLGVAGRWSTSDPSELSMLAGAATRLLGEFGPLTDRGPRPLAFAAIAFDRVAPATGPFAGWPLAELVLPRFLLWEEGGAHALVVAGEPGEDEAALLVRLDELFGRRAEGEGDRPPAASCPDGTDDGPMEEGDAFERRVGRAVTEIGRGRVEKVAVLRARRLRGGMPGPMAFLRVAAREQPGSAHLWWDGEDGRSFAALTPERLLQADASRWRTEALAGTWPKEEGGSDDEARRSLLESGKDGREHRAVLDFLRGALPEAEADGTEVVDLPYAFHLRTTVRAPRRGGYLLDFALRLHPTPAVAGLPTATARALVQDLEPDPRGWFAGAIGWVLPGGEGELSVAIRSGLLGVDGAWTWAGAGIVEGSVPALERREVEVKLGALAGCLDAARLRSTLPPAAASNRQQWMAAVLIDVWTGLGLRDLCLSPGSRSTPLALAAAARADLRVHVHLDERCSAFFALGLARATGRPVAVLTTSGSAAAHVHPAVLEADLGSVPLLVLTADRPARLQDLGAPQTMEQRGLYGGAVRHAEHIAVEEANAESGRWLHHRGARVWERLLGDPPGPVHVNVAFDEPLAPVRLGDVPNEALSPAPTPRILASRRSASVELSGPGLIVAGPGPLSMADQRVILDLAERAGAPVLADALSGLRAWAHPLVVDTADAWLRDADCALALSPRWVLRCGRLPTSKATVQALRRWERARHVVLDADGRLEDPDLAGGTWLRAWPRELRVRHRDVAPDFAARVLRVAEAVSHLRAEHLAHAPLGWEGPVIPLLAHAVGGGVLLVASSMPVRDVDSFLPRGVFRGRLLASRGLNGIDGLVSTTLGIAATGVPTWGYLGDLAILHDAGGLAAVRAGLARATFLVPNNDGGAIFEHLPVARVASASDLRQLLVTPHGMDLRALASQYGLEHHAPRDLDELLPLLPRDDTTPPRIIELRVDRAQSLRLHHRYHRAAAAAARAALDLPNREDDR